MQSDISTPATEADLREPGSCQAASELVDKREACLLTSERTLQLEVPCFNKILELDHQYLGRILRHVLERPKARHCKEDSHTMLEPCSQSVHWSMNLQK